jgi:hypothetical protein
MQSGGAHCAVLSQHGTNGQCITDRDFRSRIRSDDDDINRELLDDSYERKESTEGELALRLGHHLSHLWRSTKVRTVHGVYQERRVGDS